MTQEVYDKLKAGYRMTWNDNPNVFFEARGDTIVYTKDFIEWNANGQTLSEVLNRVISPPRVPVFFSKEDIVPLKSVRHVRG